MACARLGRKVGIAVFLWRTDMNPLALLFERPESWLLVLLLVVLLFGADRIPKAARSLGRSVSEFKKGVREGQEEEKKAAEEKDEEKKPEKPT